MLVKQQAVLDIPTLQYITPQKTCTFNRRHISTGDENNEYRVIHSEDKVDTHLVDKHDDDDGVLVKIL